MLLISCIGHAPFIYALIFSCAIFQILCAYARSQTSNDGHRLKAKYRYRYCVITVGPGLNFQCDSKCIDFKELYKDWSIDAAC